MKKEMSRVRTTGECCGCCHDENKDKQTIIAQVSGVQFRAVCPKKETKETIPENGTSETTTPLN